MSFSENLYLHAFNLLPEFGPSRLYRIAKHFSTFNNAYAASAVELQAAGIEPKLVNKFISLRQGLNLNQQQDQLNAAGIFLISYRDQTYPKLLLETQGFPVLLYVKGHLQTNDELCLAVVGTRKISNYGRLVVPELVTPLCQAGLVIVSGLAYGVDSLAHQTAVKLGRRTIAVLGGGLDERSLYPQNHLLLAEEILNTGGALLSEYPPGTPCLKHHFISRNRIISGLAVGTLVVECGASSGSLITARHALEQNRNVYAVPGSIYSPESEGPNNLIKVGAKPVTRAEDILEDLNLPTVQLQNENQKIFNETLEENLILKTLAQKPLTIDELIKLSGLPAADANSALTFLEMKGKIKNLGYQQYMLNK